jgi:CMP-N,N'-diacetyllegionaminic acid synthase
MEHEMSVLPILAVIPSRGGSKGLPGKNIRPLAGLPLLAHSIRLAKLCPEIAQCIVSTDSEEIATVARAYGGVVPFLRPGNLAQDDTPMWPVLQHALQEMELRDGCSYGSLLLLEPTSPGRLPEDVQQAIQILEDDPACVGVIAVSEPRFNPRWVCVEPRPDGYIRQSFVTDHVYIRRQDVPPVYRINGSLYLWRRDHIANSIVSDIGTAPHRMLNIPEIRAIDIDDIQDFNLAELWIRERFVQLPWL